MFASSFVWVCFYLQKSLCSADRPTSSRQNTFSIRTRARLLILWVILVIQPSWRAEPYGSTVRRNKCDVCLIGSVFLHKLDKWRKNYTLGTRDNFSADKSLMMSHLHFTIWAAPNIDQWTAFVEMSPVKVMDAGQAITHPSSRICSADIESTVLCRQQHGWGLVLI